MVSPSLGPSMSDADRKIKYSSSGLSSTSSKSKHVLAYGDPKDTKYVWNLTKVPDLPEFQSLERTTVLVPDSSPAMVSSRVSSILRERSIQATYDDELAKVKAITSDGVDFRIRLYRGRFKGNFGIIVEVQRRFGTSFQFHSDSQAILDAVQGKTPAPVRKSIIPEVSQDLLDSDDEDVPPPPPSGSSSSLFMVERMLSLPGFDARYLGLQTLSALVDPQRMSLQTARQTALTLFKTESAVGDEILSYISRRNNKDESHTLLRVMALGILANAMKASGVVPEALRLSLRQVLLQDLLNAKDNTNAALLAVKCMEYFIRGDHDTIELHEAFEAARKVGEERHLALMEQAQRCISRIR